MTMLQLHELWLPIAVALLFVGLSKYSYDYLFLRGKRSPYPPGPEPKWLVGNMFDFPIMNPAQEYVAWGKKYNSDILHASSLGNHVVILNNWQDVEELIDRRGAKYSDRPVLPIVNIMGWDNLFALYQSGDHWLRHRMICKKNFGRDASKNYEPIIQRKVHDLLLALLEAPDKFYYHSQMLSISIPMLTMYGYDVKSIDDPCIAAANNATVISGGLTVPGASLINVFPILRHVPPWFPGASSRKLAEKARKYSEEAQRIPLEYVEKCMANGTAAPSLVSDFLEMKQTIGATEEEERIIKSVAYTVYSGGSDTTMSASETFFYLMTLNPEVQRKAQEEIDRVVGSRRLPNLEDRNSLPYIEAVYREIMRWNPPLPILPHRVSEDDWYKGYFIPKDAAIIINLWAMAHDEAVFPEPSLFKPERHLSEDGTLAAADFSLVYGCGRRVCPGKYVGSSTMWLVTASVLACFNIGKAKDEHGRDIEIDPRYVNSGLLSRKEPFKCSIKPRSPTAQLLTQMH